jgi:hypothetical protein
LTRVVGVFVAASAASPNSTEAFLQGQTDGVRPDLRAHASAPYGIANIMALPHFLPGGQIPERKTPRLARSRPRQCIPSVPTRRSSFFQGQTGV